MDNNYFGNICYCRKCNGIVHTIKKGDSLYLLSRYYNVPIGEIMNANRHLNIYNLQIGEEICIPIRRSDMLNDNVNNGMNNIPNSNNMSNGSSTSNGNMSNGNSTSNGNMSNAMPEINIPDDNMPALQMPTENRNTAGTTFDESDYGYMEASCVSCSRKTFDKNIKMSELINQEDMTFEKFLSLIQN